MRNFSVFILICLFLAQGSTVSAGTEEVGFYNESVPGQYRWFPMAPLNMNNNRVSLGPGEEIRFELPGDSALKITGVTDSVEVFREYFTWSEEGTAVSRVPYLFCFVSDSSVEIPSEYGSGITLMVRSSDGITGRCYHRVRTGKGTDWIKESRIINRLVSANHPVSLNVMDGDYSPDTMVYRQFRQLENPERIPRGGEGVFIREILMAARLLDQQRVRVMPVTLPGQTAVIDDEIGVLVPHDLEWITEGPALCKITLRTVWPDTQTASQMNAFLSISLDDLTVDETHRTFGYHGGDDPLSISAHAGSAEETFQELTEIDASLGYSRYLYVPSGNHTIKIQSDQQIWCAIERITPVDGSAPGFPTARQNIVISQLNEKEKPVFRSLITLGLDLIPGEYLQDPEWLTASIRDYIDHPLLENEWWNIRNSGSWSRLESGEDQRLFFDPPVSVSSRDSGGSGRFNPGTAWYRLPVNQAVDVPGSSNDELTELVVYDPEKRAEDPPVDVVVDDRAVLIKESWIPGREMASFMVLMTPGAHTLEIRNTNRPLFTQTLLHGSHPVSHWMRGYSRLVPGTSLNYVVDGGAAGRRLRVLWRYPDSGNHVLAVTMGNRDEVTVACDHRNTDPAGFVLTVPPGVFPLTIQSDAPETGWINAGMFSAEQSGPGLSGDSDPDELDKITRFHDSISGLPVSEEISSKPAWEKAVLAAISGDLYRCRMLSSDWELSPAGESVVRTWIDGMTGYHHRALESGLDVVSRYQYRPLWFQELLMEAAMRAGDPVSAWRFVREILKETPEHEAALLTKARLLIHLGDRREAGKILEMFPTDLSPLSMIRDHTRRSLKTSVMDLPDDWAVLSPNPLFKSLPPDLLETRGPVVNLISDNPDSSHDSRLEKFDSGVECIALNENTGIRFTVKHPTVIRLVVRPDTFPDADSTFTPGMGIEIVWRDRDESRIMPVWECPGEPDPFFRYAGTENIVPGKAEIIEIPVFDPESPMEIRCVAGSGTVQVRVQVPGIDDNPAPNQNMISSVQTLHALIWNPAPPDTGMPPGIRILTAAALLHQIKSDFPHRKWIQTMEQFIRRSVQYRVLNQFSNDNPYCFVPFETLPHDTVISNRASVFPDPEPGIPAHIMTPGSSLTFTADGLPPGIITLKASTDPLRKFGFTITADNFPDASLLSESIKEYMCNVRDIRDGILEIALDEATQHPAVKVSCFHSRSGKKRPVPLNETRKYFLVGAGNAVPVMRGRVFGPTVLKLDLRSLNPVEASAETVTVRLTGSDGSQFTQSVTLPSDRDDAAMRVEGFARQSPRIPGLPGFLDISLPDTGPYTMEIKSHGSPVLVRIAAAVFREPERAAIEPMDPIPMEGSKPAENEMPPADTVEQQWNSGVPSDLPLRGQSGGTWLFGARYRDRTRGADADDSTEYFGNDGITGEIGYLRRFEGSGLFCDVRIRGTKPKDEPDAVLGGLDQVWSWNTGFYRLRFRLETHSSFQEIASETEHRNQMRFGIRRSWYPRSYLTIVPFLELFWTDQSLDGTDVSSMDSPVDPRIFNYFDYRHETGAYGGGLVRWNFSRKAYLYSSFRTMTGGSEDSGILGPWWWRMGFRTMAGPVMLDAVFTERDAFGDSLEPNRTRAAISARMFHWSDNRTLWEFRIMDRYTFDTEQNDIRVELRLHFSAGRLLRDFDPFRIPFKSWVEALL